MSCPPCHGECRVGKKCPAENHPAFDNWVKWAKSSVGEGYSFDRFTFTRSSHGQAFRSGWDAGFAYAKEIVKGGEEWKLLDNDQA
jgi:hypothetical protein